ncbi:MAG: DUF4191 domain-containing protein [Propionibacteriaceae bacterium]|nr:DUF4191 domain-containing protein [Propionibacteriaceae bacterium]
MASERAKELAAKQKAEAKAAKLAKKNSTNPEDWGQFRQIVHSVKLIGKAKPAWKWLMIVSFIVPLVIVAVAGYLVGPWIPGLISGILVGAIVFMAVLVVLTRKYAYSIHAGEPGQAEVALRMLTTGRKPKWSYTAQIAFNQQGDSVHRVVGPGGLILIGDGDPARLRQLLTAERRRHDQLMYDVSVQTILAGDGEGAVPVDKLAKKLQKLPKTLSATQITQIEQRLKALDAIRGRLPMPKGPVPSMKGAHRALRGR